MKISQGFCIALALGIGLTFARELPDGPITIGAMLGGGFRLGAAIIGAASRLIGAVVYGLLLRKRILTAVFLGIGFLCGLALADGFVRNKFVCGLIYGYTDAVPPQCKGIIG
jgi:hypothetical protein